MRDYWHSYFRLDCYALTQSSSVILERAERVALAANKDTARSQRLQNDSTSAPHPAWGLFGRVC